MNKEHITILYNDKEGGVSVNTRFANENAGIYLRQGVEATKKHEG